MWTKDTKKLEKIDNVDGAIFFGTRLKQGGILFSSNRQFNQLEKDHFVRLYFISSDYAKIKIKTFGTWKNFKKGFRFKFAQLRFQRNEGSELLVLSALNLKEFKDSQLIIFDEKQLFPSSDN